MVLAASLVEIENAAGAFANRGWVWFAETGDYFTMRYYLNVVVPTLFATWGVWIPVVTILYSLPSLLQIPLFGLALSLWVMLYTWMSERRRFRNKETLRRRNRIRVGSQSSPARAC